MPRPEARPVTLEFDKRHITIGDDTDLRAGLSAVAFDGDHLWLACDEGCRLERLSRTGASAFSSHRVFPLDELLDLPADREEEADIEGLWVDAGWLWLVGSHSVKRGKPKKGSSSQEVVRKLSKLGRDGNRHLLARVPLVNGCVKTTDGRRTAAALRATDSSSALLDGVRQRDPVLAPFIPLPGKDNGFDVEGLAVRGPKVFVGLRGPVLREWCCILELDIDAQGSHLHLKPFKEGTPYRKHFLKLNGLGVRDLVMLDNDLLILVGPSMAHDGPCEIWRWKNGVRAGNGTPEVTRLLELPQGARVDRPEGFTVLERSGGATTVLIVFDTPAETRLRGNRGVLADAYTLP